MRNQYESDEFYNNMPDMLLRPGGFELTRRLLELAGFTGGAGQGKILDVGCGAGACVRFLSDLGYDATGVDKSAKLIEHGKRALGSVRCEAGLVTGCGEALPFEDTCFDAVLYECSFSLMDGIATLAEARRVLKSGRFLLVSDVFRGAGRTGDMRSLDEFAEILRSSGFEVKHTEDKTNVFESFIAQVIMSTGSLDTLYSCDEWSEIKRAKPRYVLTVAQKNAAGEAVD